MFQVWELSVFTPQCFPTGGTSAPIINTILEDVHESGVTMYYISEGLDDGDIIGQKPFQVGSNDYAGDIYKKVIQTGKELILIYLPMLAEGTAPRIPQKNNGFNLFSETHHDG